MKLRSIDEVIDTDFKDDLTDSSFAAGYLQASLEEAQAQGDIGVFLIALADVVKTRGSVATAAAHVGKTRASFYKSLSRTGNPGFATVALTLPALGFKLQVVEDKDPRGTEQDSRTEASTEITPREISREEQREPVAACL